MQTDATVYFLSKQLRLFVLHGSTREPTQKTQDIDPIFFWYYPTVYDFGPVSKHHWIHVLFCWPR